MSTRPPDHLGDQSTTEQRSQPVGRSSPSLARLATTVGVVLWVAALFLPAFLWPSHVESGFSALTRGALGIFSFNVAWYANVLAFIWLLAAKPSPKLATAAALLSLQAFMFAGEPGIGGNGGSPIVGLGWGAILWVCSFQFLLIADAVSEPGHRSGFISAIATNRGKLGVASLAVTVAVTGWLAFSERQRAGVEDRAKLKTAVFLRGAVCDADPPQAGLRVDRTQPLKVDLNSYELSDPTALLAGGLVDVTSGEWRYVLADPSEAPFSLKRLPATGPAPSSHFQYRADDKRIIARVNTSGGGAGFEWKQLRGGRMCPGISDRRSAESDPMRYVAAMFEWSKDDVYRVLFEGVQPQPIPQGPKLRIEIEATRDRVVDYRYEPSPTGGMRGGEEVAGCGDLVSAPKRTHDGRQSRTWLQIGATQFAADGMRLLRCEEQRLYGFLLDKKSAMPRDHVGGEFFVWDIKGQRALHRWPAAVPNGLLERSRWLRVRELPQGGLTATVVREKSTGSGYEEIDVRLDGN